MFLRGTTLALLILLLPACGGGPTGDVATAVGIFNSPFIAIDLPSGRIESYAALNESDIRTDVRWKTTKLLFRRISVGGTVGVSGTALGADPDEPSARAVPSQILFVAVFELTQAQWTALGGQARWLDAGIQAAGAGIVADAAPAYGLSRDDVTQVMTSFNAGRNERIVLPTDDQWEVACRGGVSGTLFWWGDDPLEATVVTQVRARVAETLGSAVGAQAVDADRLPNAVGLYDVHGNLWEWVSSTHGTVRGGSWNDTVSMARAANRLALDQSTHHPLVGVRLLLQP